EAGYPVILSGDGRHALTTDDRTAIIWDAETGEKLHTLAAHSDYVNHVAFSRDGRLALTGSGDQTAIVWDVGTGKVIQSLRGRSDSVLNPVFDYDGRLIIAGSYNQEARRGGATIWDLESGRATATFDTGTKWPVTASFSPDGRRALVVSTGRLFDPGET